MLKRSSFKQDHLVTVILLLFLILFFILTYLSDISYGGADDIVHYRFARYAFKYPHLFLDHWAKPLFTILASPFAQFGFLGIKTFNLLVGLCTAYFTYRVTKLLHYKYNYLVVFFVCFAPVYLSMILSGMTEIIFSFVLTLTVFLALRRNFIWSALLLSLLPFARNEGIVVFPFFLLYYIINRKYWTIPFLSAGFIFFSLLGAYYYHDLFWVITKMPYTGAKDIYGSGELLHFVNETKFIFGIPLAILFGLGISIFFYKMFKAGNFRDIIGDSYVTKEGLLIIAPFFAYFVAHSILWWQGWGGSLGLTRVIAGVVPLFAIIGLKGLYTTLELIRKIWLKFAIILVVLYLIITTPFKIYQFPLPLDGGQKVVKKASVWVKENGYLAKRVYYYNHYFWFFLDLNPFDSNSVWEAIPHNQTPSKDVPDSCVVIWDAHFSSNEGRLPLETMMNDSMMRLLKVFRPRVPFIVMGGHNYEVCVFQKTSQKFDIAENYKTYKDSTDRDTLIPIMFKALNFDSLKSLKDFNTSDSIAYSGKHSCLIRNQDEFGPGFAFQYKELPDVDIIKVKASFWIWTTSKEKVKDVHIVASVEHKNKLYYYQAVQLDTSKFKNGQWNQLMLNIALPEPSSKRDIIKIYPWNKGKQRFYMDDFTVILVIN